MNALKQWLANHKSSAHIITAIWVTLQGAYEGSDAFRTGVNTTVVSIYHALPKGISGIIGSLIVPLFLYWNTQRKTVVKAEVEPGEQGVAAASAIAGSSGPKIVAVLAVAALLTGSISLAGCTDFERKTFQTLSASKAVIDQAQADYESGKLPHVQASYDAINKANDAQAAAVKSFQGYQTSKLIVKSGGDLPAQQQAVAQALAQLGPLVAAVKQLYSGVK